MFYYQTFFLLQICSLLDCSQQIPEKKIGGQRARLRKKGNLFRYRALFEGNLLRFARARAHVRALMTQKSCAVEMRNAILRNYLKSQTVVAIRGVCYSHEAHLNTFSSDRPCLSDILPFPLFFVAGFLQGELPRVGGSF